MGGETFENFDPKAPTLGKVTKQFFLSITTCLRSCLWLPEATRQVPACPVAWWRDPFDDDDAGGGGDDDGGHSA